MSSNIFKSKSKKRGVGFVGVSEGKNCLFLFEHCGIP